MLSSEKCIIITMLLCIAGALFPSLYKKSWINAGKIAFGFGFLASLAAILGSIISLSSSQSTPLTLFAYEKLGFSLKLHVDELSAVFVLLISVITIPALLFCIRYMEHYKNQNPGWFYFNLFLFLFAMYGLVTTTDMMYFFFIFWQMMTITGWLLIKFDKNNPQNILAARKFLVMMQIACFVTMIGAGILAKDNYVTSSGELILKYDFESVRHYLPTVDSRASVFAFLMFLIGFGIKMGMWPFGKIWLPDAHPAAPSPVSALLSGVMIKTGVYGLMRYFLWLPSKEILPIFPFKEWGYAITILGTITLYTGTAMALRQHQAKRLLAFHSIGQIGYIIFGAGACMVLIRDSSTLLQGLGVLAFCGSLFHTINHGLFKSLLFLNAGSFIYATGIQDLNKAGGLSKILPWTAATALIASLSISGVPLFNGFASKWLIIVPSILAHTNGPGILAIPAIIAMATSAITLASFVKYFGTMFLGAPGPALIKSEKQKDFIFEPWQAIFSQVYLSIFCVLLGILPGLGLTLVSKTILSNADLVSAQVSNNLINAEFFGESVFNNYAIFIPAFLIPVILLALVMGIFVGTAGRAQKRRAKPWACGYEPDDINYRFTANHYYSEAKKNLPFIDHE